MRARLDTLIADRLAVGAAVPALTCYDVTTALGVIAGAEASGDGVVLLVTPKTAGSAIGMRFIRILRMLADDASVPVIVQLDHATDRDLILRAVEAGADAVLADGSSLSLDENAAFVADIVASAPGVVVEAELGSLAGDEDRAFAVEASGKTDPEQVAAFVAASGCHLLATSVGNVHGHYAGTPALDWPLIEAIRAESSVPLALHGASGLPDGDLERAGRAGLGKVNINTELRAAVLDAVSDALPDVRSHGDDVLAYEAVWREAARVFATAALVRLGGYPGSEPYPAPLSTTRTSRTPE